MGRIDAKELVRVFLDIEAGRHDSLKNGAKWLLAQYPKPTTVDQVVKSAVDSLTSTVMFEGLDEEAAQAALPFCIAMFMYGRDGCPHFSLTPDFFNAITLTDFGDGTDEPLHLPFDAFTISYPPTSELDGSTRMFVFRLPKITKMPDGELDIKWTYCRMNIIKKQTVFTQWPADMTRKRMIDEAERLRVPVGKAMMRELDEPELAMIDKARLTLMNTLTYIEASGKLPSAKRRHGDAPLPVERVHVERPLFEVGRPVRLDASIRRALAEGTSRPGWKLARRFIVRGHWRNQAHGPERTLRTRRWIEPHWKGPDVIEAMSRTYEVK